MKGIWETLLVSMLLALCATSPAAEPISVSGVIEKAPAGQFFSSYFLRDANNGGLLGGLRDPQNMLSSGNRRVTLQVEKASYSEVDGLPIFKVVTVSPEYWAQPASW